MTLALTLGCMACVVGLLISEARSRDVPRAVFKLAASALFVLVGFGAGALASPAGTAILVALFLCALGDVLLLSRRDARFLAGMGAFALAHAAYAGGFVLAGAECRPGVGASLAAMAAFSFLVLRRLRPRLGKFRVPVIVYAAIIAMMTTAAVAASLATGEWRYGVGAALFAVSDVAVARDRFIKESFGNRLWGLPLYYAAQLILASSV
jgi:uncharacterized membrane protein YhhN